MKREKFDFNTAIACLNMIMVTGLVNFRYGLKIGIIIGILFIVLLMNSLRLKIKLRRLESLHNKRFAADANRTA